MHPPLEEAKTYDEFKSNLAKYTEFKTKVIELVQANNYDGAVALCDSQELAILQPVFDKLQILIDENVKEAGLSNSNNIAQFNSTKNAITLYTAIAFLLILLIAYIISITIMNPLNRIKGLAERLSAYNFSTPMLVKNKDEFGQTGNALNTAQENIKGLVKEIMSNASDMSASSEELSATVQEITAKIEIIDGSTVEINKSVQEASATSGK